MRRELRIAAILIVLVSAGCAKRPSSGEAHMNPANSDRVALKTSEIEEVTADDFRRGQSIGKRMPSFEMKPVGGGEPITRESLRGKVVLLDFWASWCGPCKLAIPSLKRLHEEFSGRGLAIIGANAGEVRSGPAPAEKYKSQHSIPYTLTYDNDQLVRILGIQGYPAFILFDQSGVVRLAQLGFDEAWMKGPVRDEILRLLGD